MILRITDLNGYFLRDDFTFDEENEIGLDVEPAQGMYEPRWDFETSEWVETGEVPEPAPQEPTELERLDNLENTILMLLITGG